MKKIYLALAIALVAAGVFRLKAEATGMGESRGFRLEAEGMGDPGTGDWPMWGGTADRNMVSNMKGLPLDWDVKTKKNVKWVADLGSQTYGNVVVAGGMVFVGTNNEGLRDPKQPGDRGVLMAFKEDTGEFLWQQTHEKLTSGRANDWPYQGVASSPLVEGNKLYYVSNRGVLWCLDIKGFSDGNQGPITDEKLTGPKDADAIWSFDMMDQVGSYPHNLSNSSPVSFGKLIFVSTSNGQDESHVHIPSPKAPAIIAVDKVTGELAWEDNSVGDKILHGQWSTPSVGKIGGVDQVVSAQGDGWVRGYEVLTGKKLWEFDTNPKDSVWPKTRNEVIATPVIYDDKVYIANGQDPEHGEGVGHMYAIDATKRGDITKTGRSRRRRSPTASSTSPTSAASCTASTPRPARSTGRTTSSPRCGARRWWSTGASTSATKTATSSSSRRARRRRCWRR